MAVRIWLTWISLAGVLAACREDEASTASGGMDVATDGTAGAPDATEPTGGASGGGALPECEVDEACDDDDPCTTARCNAGSCEFSPAVAVACRPTIDIEYPPRGATIEATSSNDVVTVMGSVSSPAADIVAITLNGDPVALGPDGSFSVDVDPVVGGNTLVFETEDAQGQTRRRVQSYLWGTRFVAPQAPDQGMAPQGLAIYFSEEGLDDGEPNEPYDDLASILGLAIASIDLGSFFDPNERIAREAGYNIYLTSLGYNDSRVNLSPLDGGLAMRAGLYDIEGLLSFDCVRAGCVLLGGDGTGGLTMSGLVVEADIMLSVSDTHELDVTLENVRTSVRELEIYSDNRWTNFLLTIAERFIRERLVSELEVELDGRLQQVLTPLLSEALSSFNFETELALPGLADPQRPVAVQLVTDFGATQFHDGLAPPASSPPAGGAIVLRTGGFANGELPYSGLGFPLRNGCELEQAGISLTRAANMEIGVHDDTVNELLYGAWRGGWLEFPLPEGFIADNPIVAGLELTVSGMLPPVASDCNDQGALLVTLGDIRIEATLEFNGRPMSFTAFITARVGLEVTATQGTISFTLGAVEQVQTELNVHQDEAIAAEAAITSVVESALLDQLLGGLGSDGLGGIELPEIDLSESLGLPPGTAMIAIEANDSVRLPGTTVIQGSL